VINLAQKKVAVTGGHGFLGRHVVAALQRRGAVVSVPRKSQYDLTREADVERMYSDLEPDIVIHLAAVVGGIGANRDSPGLFFFENVMLGALTLEHARRRGVEKFVGVGTICAYPKLAPVPFMERDLWNGYPEETNAPYGIAKKMMIVQSMGYREQYGLHSIVLFPVNLYGPRDNFDLHTSHVIPAMVRKFVSARENGDKEVVLWGDGSPTREFLYVEDAAEGIVLGAERYDSSDPVNLGSGVEISIRDLAEKIAKAARYEGRFVWDTSKPNGQPRRRLDVTRAKERFGFTAGTTFDRGIAATVAYYEEHRREIDSK